VKNGEKLFLSEPNPSFNKDLRETASRKHIYNLPAREMMSRLITECNIEISSKSASKLDTALYFGPFGPFASDNHEFDVEDLELDMDIQLDSLKPDILNLVNGCNPEHPEHPENPEHTQKNGKNAEIPEDSQDTQCVATRFSKTCTDRLVYNSNIDFHLPELLQDFSTTSDVYFGWNNYYLCSYKDFKNYIRNKTIRKIPIIPTFNELSKTDSFLAEKIEILKHTKAYAQWFWWLPFWKSYRENMIRSAQKVVDDYYENKRREFEKIRDEAILYENDLHKILTELDNIVMNQLLNDKNNGGNISSGISSGSSSGICSGSSSSFSTSIGRNRVTNISILIKTSE
jgi:hypothetical protein